VLTVVSPGRALHRAMIPIVASLIVLYCMVVVAMVPRRVHRRSGIKIASLNYCLFQYYRLSQLGGDWKSFEVEDGVVDVCLQVVWGDQYTINLLERRVQIPSRGSSPLCGALSPLSSSMVLGTMCRLPLLGFLFHGSFIW
jgi:hypothetical protein